VWSTAGRSFGNFLRWQRTSRAIPWPKRVENRATPNLPTALETGEIAIMFIHQVTYVVQFRGLNVLTDPVYAERVSPVQWSAPRRVREPGLAFDARPRVDTVLVSHSHYDQLDLHTLQRLEAAHRPLFLTGLGERCGRVDVAMLPIGAYEPRWLMQDMHMNPDDAVRAHLDLETVLSIGTHRGCFQLTDEGIDEPLRGLEVARQRHGVAPHDFRALETGATLRLGA